MGFFKKKKVESKLDYILKSQDVKLVLNENEFDMKSATSIPCMILGSDELFEVVGGTAPYRLDVSSLEGFDFVEKGYFKMKGKMVASNQIMNESIVELIRCSIPIRVVMEFIEKKVQKGNLFVTVQDSGEVRPRERVTMSVDFSIFREQMGRHFQERINLPETKVKVYEEYSSGDHLRFKIIFTPYLEIASLGNGIPELKVDLGNNFRKVFSHEYRTEQIVPGFSSHKLEEVVMEVEDIPRLMKQKENVIEGSFIVKTRKGEIARQIKVDVSECKRFAIMNFYKPIREWDESNLVAVTAVYKKWWNKVVENQVFGKKTLYGTPRRPTIHFTLNHVVRSHGQGSWEDTDRILVMPFKELVELNKETVYGGTNVDFFFVGFVRIPKSMQMVDRLPGESWESFKARANNTILELGCKVVEGGDYGWGEEKAREGKEIVEWWTNFRERKGWIGSVHFYSEFMKSELYTFDNVKEDGNFAERFNHDFQESYPDLFKKFRKPLIAWASYWKKKAKII